MEKNLSEEFIKQGYVIRKVSDYESLRNLRNIYVDVTKFILANEWAESSDEEFLNFIHNAIDPKKLNELRLKVIDGVNSNQSLRPLFYKSIREYLDIIVGNELAMQVRLNLSIQCPGDSDSLLPVHSDTWSGDSPFEVVAWMPLVNCYKTKSMYILPQKYYDDEDLFKNVKNSECLYKKIEGLVEWIEVDYGEILIFNQTLPHGNRLNEENETRWSINCRFKSIYSPYGDKKLGEFFEPITFKPASIIGMGYKFPKIYE